MKTEKMYSVSTIHMLQMPTLAWYVLAMKGFVRHHWSSSGSVTMSCGNLHLVFHTILELSLRTWTLPSLQKTIHISVLTADYGSLDTLYCLCLYVKYSKTDDRLKSVILLVECKRKPSFLPRSSNKQLDTFRYCCYWLNRMWQGQYTGC